MKIKNEMDEELQTPCMGLKRQSKVSEPKEKTPT